MRLAGAVFIAGFILSGLAVIPMLLVEEVELRGDETLVIPEGPSFWVAFEVDMGDGGPIEGTFECLEGTSVRLSVMDGDQFEAFLDMAGDDSRTTVLGSSGEFLVDEVDMFECYIVLQHPPGVEAEQTVSVEYTVTSADLPYWYVSLAMLLAGGVMVYVPLYRGLKASARARAAVNKETDVVFFDE
jgi:hypothetical protein